VRQESKQSKRRLRVMIVDDHEVVRKGLRSLIDSAPDLELVGEAGTAADAVHVARAMRPDVVIMDVRLPDESGIVAAREIRAQRDSTRVLILTSYADEGAVFSAIMAGASGYLLKEVRTAELLAGIRAVGAGHSLLDPAVTSAVLERVREVGRPIRDPKLVRLSPQERRVLELVAEGLTNIEIGHRLRLSDKTVKNYVSWILGKLEVSRRAEAAAYLARNTRETDLP
jgi:two-component system, NarL family, response regulator DevR